MKPTLSIIVPVYNEIMRLPGCIEQLSGWLRMNNISYEIIAVDNGSTDATLKVCSEIAKFNNNFYFDALGVRGKGLAVRHGMLNANGDYRYMCDVDLSAPAAELRNFLDAIKYADVVIGSRELDTSRVRTSKQRHFIGRVFHSLASSLVPGIEDTQCGFKMFTARAARDIFERAHVNSMAFDVEALWLAQRLGYRVKEIPVTWHADYDSRVQLIRDGWQMFTDIVQIPMLHAMAKIPA